MKKIIPFRGNFPLSHAIIHNYPYTAELSGFIGVDPETNELEAGIENQTKRVLSTINETLKSIGWSMNDVIKMRIFMRDMSEYSKMNDTYATCFDGEYPTRFVVGVTELPRNALIEIECTASSDKTPI